MPYSLRTLLPLCYTNKVTRLTPHGSYYQISRPKKIKLKWTLISRIVEITGWCKQKIYIENLIKQDLTLIKNIIRRGATENEISIVARTFHRQPPAQIYAQKDFLLPRASFIGRFFLFIPFIFSFNLVNLRELLRSHSHREFPSRSNFSLYIPTSICISSLHGLFLCYLRFLFIILAFLILDRHIYLKIPWFL